MADGLEAAVVSYLRKLAAMIEAGDVPDWVTRRWARVLHQEMPITFAVSKYARITDLHRPVAIKNQPRLTRERRV